MFYCSLVLSMFEVLLDFPVLCDCVKGESRWPSNGLERMVAISVTLFQAAHVFHVIFITLLQCQYIMFFGQ